MRHTNPRGWTDLNEFGYIHQPNAIIRAADLTSLLIEKDTDRYRPGVERKILYEDADGKVWYLELEFYVHPTGAGALTLGTLSWSGEVATYTPTLEGRLLLYTGALTGAGALAEKIAGMLFTDYYEHIHDNDKKMEHFHALTIEEGDGVWLIKRGEVEADYDGTGAPTAVDFAMKTAASGKVTKSTAYGVGSLAAVQENIVGHGQKCVGHCTEAVSAAGQVGMVLDLPRRFPATF